MTSGRFINGCELLDIKIIDKFQIFKFFTSMYMCSYEISSIYEKR